ncbi:MAG: helix-turn-helix transcriptional regulator [Clostridia bacterium]|nr:helix-turn-helix transcriptional regulator [Clostridia bacterium]
MSRMMGEKLKELRKTNGMTQEQVAQALNVSFQTISRWENGLSYPDIMLVPVIARLFDVSTDTLFDMNTNRREQLLEQYEQQYMEYCKKGNLSARLLLMREALEQFPRNYHFVMNLAETMYLFAGGSATEKEEYANGRYAQQIRAICDRVLDECHHEQERLRANALLCRYYAAAGNRQEAARLANSMADFDHCREKMLAEILCGEEKKHFLQQSMLKAMDYVVTTLVEIAFSKEYEIAASLSVDERISYIQAANNLIELFITDGNLQCYHRMVGWNHRRLCELYLFKGDTEVAFQQLLEAERHASAYDTRQNTLYTAPFINMLRCEKADDCKCWQGSERGMLLYRLNELTAYFDKHDGFMKMKKRLEEVTAGEECVKIE